ncbi:MAG: hypothetical protein ACK559_28345, partial [bacterium]
MNVQRFFHDLRTANKGPPSSDGHISNRSAVYGLAARNPSTKSGNSTPWRARSARARSASAIQRQSPPGRASP